MRCRITSNAQLLLTKPLTLSVTPALHACVDSHTRMLPLHQEWNPRSTLQPQLQSLQAGKGEPHVFDFIRFKSIPGCEIHAQKAGARKPASGGVKHVR